MLTQLLTHVVTPYKRADRTTSSDRMKLRLPETEVGGE